MWAHGTSGSILANLLAGWTMRSGPGLVALRVLLLSAAFGCALVALSACRNPGRADEATQQAVRSLIAKAMGENQIAIDRGEDFEARDLPSAVKYLREAETRAGDDPALRVEVGRGFFYVSRVDDATRLIGQVVASSSLAPGSDAWIVANEMMGRIHLASGDFARAEPLIRGAADGLDEQNRRDPRAYYGCPYQALGLLYAETGRTGEAAQLFQKAADHESGNAEAQLEAVERSLEAGDLEAAARYVRRALATGRSPRAILQASLLLRLVDHHRERLRGGGPPPPAALAAAEVAVARRFSVVAQGAARGAGGRSPGEYPSAGLIVPLLVADFERGDFAVVADVANALLAVSETQYWTTNRGPLRYLFGFVALTRRDFETAAAIFEAPAGDAAAERASAVGLAHLAIVAHDYGKAEGLLASALGATQPRFAGPADRAGGAAFDWLVYRMASLGLAWSAANQNRHEQAIEAYERILVVHPNDTYALLGKGNSLSGLARLDEAEVLFRRVLAREPTNPYALAELGLVDYNRGHIEAAEAAFAKALGQDDQRYTCPHEGLGLVYLRQGRLAEAKQAFEKAIAIEPDIEYKKYNGLAKIHLKDGRVDEARRLLEKSIANYPHDPEARELLSTLPAAPTAPLPAR